MPIESTKPFAIDCLLTPTARKAFLDNWTYIHDLDYYGTKSLTCLQHPIDKLFNNGFKGGHGSSRKIKRIETSSIVSCISLEQIQDEMHGGQSIPAFDFYNAPVPLVGHLFLSLHFLHNLWQFLVLSPGLLLVHQRCVGRGLGTPLRF